MPDIIDHPWGTGFIIQSLIRWRCFLMNAFVLCKSSWFLFLGTKRLLLNKYLVVETPWFGRWKSVSVHSHDSTSAIFVFLKSVFPETHRSYLSAWLPLLISPFICYLYVDVHQCCSWDPSSLPPSLSLFPPPSLPPSPFSPSLPLYSSSYLLSRLILSINLIGSRHAWHHWGTLLSVSVRVCVLCQRG